MSFIAVSSSYSNSNVIVLVCVCMCLLCHLTYVFLLLYCALPTMNAAVQLPKCLVSEMAWDFQRSTAIKQPSHAGPIQ